MKEYLVTNHLYGGYYVTTGNPVDIEAVCQQCFDSDNIEASWEKGEYDEEVKAILPCLYEGAYINSGFENEEENLKNWLIDYGYEEVDFDIEEDIIDSFKSASEMVNYLEENKDISPYVAGRLRGEISMRQRIWCEMLRNLVFSKFGNIKVLVK